MFEVKPFQQNVYKMTSEPLHKNIWNKTFTAKYFKKHLYNKMFEIKPLQQSIWNKTFTTKCLK